MNRRELIKAISLMLGGMATASLSRAILAAQTTPRVAAQPVFAQHQKKQVAALSELIIPTTDTPGAIAAGVPDFIEMMVGEWFTQTERDKFLQGLKEIDDWSREHHGVDFVRANEAQRSQALAAAEAIAVAYSASSGSANFETIRGQTIDENTPFFHQIRELVVVGYYTSEVGATQEHKRFRMSRIYDGDYDLDRVDGRQWSF